MKKRRRMYVRDESGKFEIIVDENQKKIKKWRRISP
jgi:hypothetical protein